LSEKLIISYASQLLSTLWYLQSKKHIHAPGEINSNRIFFTQMYDEVLLDIGKSSSVISTEWLQKNSQSLIMNRK
jgi:hypothetical protein